MRRRIAIDGRGKANVVGTEPLEPVTIEAARAAADRIRPLAVRTPLVPLQVDQAPAEIYLKLENLQPIGAFKIRGAGNAMLGRPRASLADGVYTASSGNMAQAVAWVARRMGIAATVVVPEGTAETKLEGVRRLGAEIVSVPFADWWQVILEHRHPGLDGAFIHPVADPAVMAGNATIGLEILADLPDVDCVAVPYGGGGLSAGIASVIQAIRPAARVLACETEVAAPAAAAFAAGHPVEVDYGASFVTGIGSGSVMAEMWPLIQGLLAGSVTVSLSEIAAAIRLLVARHRIIAEGAGAAPVAAALTGKAGGGKVVAVVSGGNLDVRHLTTILAGGVP